MESYRLSCLVQTPLFKVRTRLTADQLLELLLRSYDNDYTYIGEGRVTSMADLAYTGDKLYLIEDGEYFPVRYSDDFVSGDLYKHFTDIRLGDTRGYYCTEQGYLPVYNLQFTELGYLVINNGEIKLSPSVVWVDRFNVIRLNSNNKLLKVRY